MTALYIIGGIILFFILLGLIRADVTITYAEEFGMCVKAAGIPVFRIPGKPKKVKLGDYTPKALEKKRRKEEKKALKKRKKAEKKALKAEKTKKAGAVSSGKTKNTDITGLISLITAVVKTFVTKFARSLRIKMARLHIGVATGDAAKTAVMYGGVCQGVSYLVTLLDSVRTLKDTEKTDVHVYADYLSEKPVIDIKITFSIFVYQVFGMIFSSAGTAIRELIKMNIKK